MVVWLSSLVNTMSFSSHTTIYIFSFSVVIQLKVDKLTGKSSVSISFSRAVWETVQRTGIKTQSKGGVPVAHLPPGGSAVRRAPWHSGQDAGEGCHHCEWALQSNICGITIVICRKLTPLQKLSVLLFDILHRIFWSGRMCGPSSTGVSVAFCWSRWWSVRFCRPTGTSVMAMCSLCCDAGSLKPKEQSRYGVSQRLGSQLTPRSYTYVFSNLFTNVIDVL